jgi:hypothetical protein
VLGPETFVRFYVGNIVDVPQGAYSLFMFSTKTQDGKDQKWNVDGKCCGNEIRYINHSHIPNVEYRMAFVSGISGAFPCIVTTSTLNDKDELLADYDISFDNLSDEEDDELLKCSCQAPFCCGVIGSREKPDNDSGSYVDFVRRTSVSARVSSHLKKKTTTRKNTFLPLEEDLFHDKKMSPKIVYSATFTLDTKNRTKRLDLFLLFSLSLISPLSSLLSPLYSLL